MITRISFECAQNVIFFIKSDIFNFVNLLWTTGHSLSRPHESWKSAFPIILKEFSPSFPLRAVRNCVNCHERSRRSMSAWSLWRLNREITLGTRFNCATSLSRSMSCLHGSILPPWIEHKALFGCLWTPLTCEKISLQSATNHLTVKRPFLAAASSWHNLSVVWNDF